MPTRSIAGILALIAFVIALLMGAAVGNDATTTISRALWAMAGCYGLGWAAASIGRRAMEEHLETYRRNHPLPGTSPERHTSSQHDDAVAESAASTTQDASASSAPGGA